MSAPERTEADRIRDMRGQLAAEAELDAATRAIGDAPNLLAALDALTAWRPVAGGALRRAARGEPGALAAIHAIRYARELDVPADLEQARATVLTELRRRGGEGR